MLAIQAPQAWGKSHLVLNLSLTFIHSFGSISGGITSAWNVSTIASRNVGMNFEIVLSATRKLYINSLNVAPVAMCLSVIASFGQGSNGSLKINKSKKLLINDMYFTIVTFRFIIGYVFFPRKINIIV